MTYIKGVGNTDSWTKKLTDIQCLEICCLLLLTDKLFEIHTYPKNGFLYVYILSSGKIRDTL